MQAGADALYEDAACGLLVTAADGAIQRVNRTFCHWVGRDATALVGTKLQDLFSMGGRIFHQTHWAPLLQIQGSVAEVKLDVVHADRRKLSMVLNAVRRVHDGVTLHEVALFLAEDRHRYEHELVLARRRAEELLEKEQAAQRSLIDAQAEVDRQRALAQDRALFAEQMMAIVSHDLRNPLSVIRMSAYLIGLGELMPIQQKALHRLSNSTDRATRLIGDLLDFSVARVGAGLKVEVAPIDLQALIADSVDDLRVAFPGRDIVYRPTGRGPCVASADRLHQLLGNLVANAVAYGAPDTPVVVSSTVEDHGFSIGVHNAGPAIDADLLPRLFDPMTRGEAATGADHSVGLGLFIVREIAKAHGGEVAVASSAGSGTSFTVTLPRITSPHAPSPPVPPEALAANGPESEPSDVERARQAELDRLSIDPSPEAALDDIARLAAEALDAPIALISLVDGRRQWFKSHVGLDATETPREQAFCAHAIENPGDVMVVEDAATDPRFVANPLVTGDPNIRFYAGAPLVTASGHALGTVCVIDTRPRTLDPAGVDTLRFLARQAIEMLEKKSDKKSETK